MAQEAGRYFAQLFMMEMPGKNPNRIEPEKVIRVKLTVFIVLQQQFEVGGDVHVDGQRRRINAEEKRLTCDDVTGQIFGTM
jgi:hypothetical protein